MSIPDALATSLNRLKDVLDSENSSSNDDSINAHVLSVLVEGSEVMSVRIGELPLSRAEIHSRLRNGFASSAMDGQATSVSVFCIKLDDIPILQIGGERPILPSEHGGMRKLRATIAAIEGQLEDTDSSSSEDDDELVIELAGQQPSNVVVGGDNTTSSSSPLVVPSVVVSPMTTDVPYTPESFSMELDTADAIDVDVHERVSAEFFFPDEILEKIVSSWSTCKGDEMPMGYLVRLMCVSKQFKAVVSNMSDLSVKIPSFRDGTQWSLSHMSFANLVNVSCSNSNEVEDIEMFAALPNLKRLNISGTSVDSLVPFRTGVCRNTLQDLYCADIHLMSIAGIESLSQLRFLDIHNTDCSTSVGEFHMPLLTVLNIRSSRRVFDSDFPYHTCFPSLVAFMGIPNTWGNLLPDIQSPDTMEIVSSTRDAVSFCPTLKTKDA